MEFAVERNVQEKLSKKQLEGIIADCDATYQDLNVQWLDSFLSLDGKSLFCHFNASDETTLQQAFERTDTVHNARIYPVMCYANDTKQSINVIVKRELDSPISFEALQKQEESKIACLEAHNVSFVKTYVSEDNKYWLCFYHAPDADSVRMAQAEAEMPVTRIYPGMTFTP